MAKSQTISDADARRFPVLTPPHWKREYPAIPASVPWHLVAPHEKQAKTLERLAQRGGLSVLEIHDVFHGHGYGTMRDVPAAVAFCIALNTPKEEPEPMNEDEPKPTAVNPVGAFCIGDLRQWAEDALTAGYPPQTPLYVGFGDAVTAGRESPLIPVRGLLLDKVRVHSDGEAVRPRNDADEDAGTHPGVILLLQQGTHKGDTHAACAVLAEFPGVVADVLLFAVFGSARAQYGKSAKVARAQAMARR
jgi:hypothetical protein